MKKYITIFFLLLITETLFCIPAKNNQWQTLTLSDGKTVRAKLVGDECLHYYIDEVGNKYTANGDHFVLLNPNDEHRLMTRAHDRTQQRMKRLKSNRRQQAYEGKKRGLILLVNFKDVSFKQTHTLEVFKRQVNEENYQNGAAIGSVHDYFMAQSNGRFDLTFDVKGVYNLSHNRAYYGGNVKIDGQDTDQRPGEMIAEACKLAANDVNYKDYDWDGDGEVDQVYIIYPGKGEADGGESETIWPHEWNLWSSDYGRKLTLGGSVINTYACGPELNGKAELCGIGTICHEFSHCLGLPDFYDTTSMGVADMGTWSVMSVGCFGGNGHRPSGFTAYEKWMCGWQDPTPLLNDTTITRMKPMDSYGETFIIRNEGYSNEFYLLENRQQKGWDADLPGSGLMITHVDYDEDIWKHNTINTDKLHPRCTLITADGKKPSNGHKSIGGNTHNLYPFNKVDELTETSTPAAKLYHSNADGSLFMRKDIVGITQESDSTITFRIKVHDMKAPAENDTLFYESFKDCQGTGGNDGKFQGHIASGKVYTDHPGWVYNTGGAGKECMKVGNSSQSGQLTSPKITFNGEYVLYVRLAGWVKDGKTVDIYLDDKNIDIAKGISSEHFTTYSFPFTAYGSHTLTFIGGKRFFIDDVCIVKKKAATAIPVFHQNDPKTTPRIYDLRGIYRGSSIDKLPAGIYIINGRKIKK